MNKNVKNLVSIALASSMIAGNIPVYADNSEAVVSDNIQIDNENGEVLDVVADENNSEIEEAQVNDTDVVTFNDANFEALVRKIVKKASGDVIVSDVKNIKTIDSWSYTKEIIDFTGIEYFSSLESLSIYGSKMPNLATIKALPSLKKLVIENPSVAIDLSELNKFVNLEEIDISGQKVSNVSNVTLPSSLKKLTLNNTGITDISFLSGASDLTELSITNGEVANITPIQGLSKLVKLDLSNNLIANIEPISSLSSLEYLELFDNKVANLTPLANMKTLKEIGLGENNIEDTTPLNELTNVEKIWLKDNNIKKLSDFSKLTKLKYLTVSDNDMVDLTGVKDVVSLEELHFNYNNLENLDFIGNLVNLKTVGGAFSGIKNIDGIGTCTEIVTLNLKYNHIVDVSALATLTKLQTLEINNNYIKDVKPLKPLLNLSKCDIYQNCIDTKDEESLKTLQNISGIDYRNQVKLEHSWGDTIEVSVGDTINIHSKFKNVLNEQDTITYDDFVLEKDNDNISISQYFKEITVKKEGITNLTAYYGGVDSPHTTFKFVIDSRTDKTETPVEGKYVINVKYVDDSTGDVISTADTYKTDDLGEFNVDAKVIDGYTLVGDSRKSVNIVDGTTEYNVEFRYAKKAVDEDTSNDENTSDKEEATTGTITVKFINERTGKELKEPKVIRDVEFGKDFRVSYDYIDFFSVSGESSYTVNLSKEKPTTELVFKYLENEKLVSAKIEKDKLVSMSNLGQGLKIIFLRELLELSSDTIKDINSKTNEDFVLNSTNIISREKELSDLLENEKIDLVAKFRLYSTIDNFRFKDRAKINVDVNLDNGTTAYLYRLNNDGKNATLITKTTVSNGEIVAEIQDLGDYFVTRKALKATDNSNNSNNNNSNNSNNNNSNSNNNSSNNNSNNNSNNSNNSSNNNSSNNNNSNNNNNNGNNNNNNNNNTNSNKNEIPFAGGTAAPVFVLSGLAMMVAGIKTLFKKKK